ncbi:MAG: alanine racemase [Acidobacteriota bacterium]|nr:alanine racemase [Acidobacteriota bacterium]
MTIADLRTPAVLVDKARALRNIDRMQSAAEASGLRLRPHAKTHKSPVVAGWQIARGAAGICCAKLGEAEVFADAGIEDIRIPYPLHPANADRVVALARRVRLSFIIDHARVARAWSRALVTAGVVVDVLVKVDVGFHRCGIHPDPATAVPFIAEVAALPGLRLKGLLSHAGQAYHATSEDHLRSLAATESAILRDLATSARKAGVAIDELSAGATPTARFSMEQDGLTEYRAGNYVYFDRTQVALGAASLDDCALTVLARVVSKPAASRLVLDAGSKTLSSDGARGFTPGKGYGVVLRGSVAGTGSEDPVLDIGTAGPTHKIGTSRADTDLVIERLSEEHAVVSVMSGTTDLEPGDLVRVLPNHSCVVSNLVDRAWLLDGPTVEPLPIAARGRIA